jgi:hypothetical protein
MASAAVCFQQKIKKMGNSLTMISILMLAPFFLGISPVDAAQLDITPALQAAIAAENCQSKSNPECCWVRRSWQLMGGIPSTDSCCRWLGSRPQANGIPGVHCSDDGKVKWIKWSSKSLTGAIPAALGELKHMLVM